MAEDRKINEFTCMNNCGYFFVVIMHSLTLCLPPTFFVLIQKGWRQARTIAVGWEPRPLLLGTPCLLSATPMATFTSVPRSPLLPIFPLKWVQRFHAPGTLIVMYFDSFALLSDISQGLENSCPYAYCVSFLVVFISILHTFSIWMPWGICIV